MKKKIVFVNCKSLIENDYLKKFHYLLDKI